MVRGNGYIYEGGHGQEIQFPTFNEWKQHKQYSEKEEFRRQNGVEFFDAEKARYQGVQFTAAVG